MHAGAHAHTDAHRRAQRGGQPQTWCLKERGHSGMRCCNGVDVGLGQPHVGGVRHGQQETRQHDPQHAPGSGHCVGPDGEWRGMPLMPWAERRRAAQRCVIRGARSRAHGVQQHHEGHTEWTALLDNGRAWRGCLTVSNAVASPGVCSSCAPPSPLWVLGLSCHAGGTGRRKLYCLWQTSKTSGVVGKSYPIGRQNSAHQGANKPISAHDLILTPIVTK